MANYASIVRRNKGEAKPSPGTIAHNQRFVQPPDLLPEEHRLENYHLVKISNATKTFKTWETENEERYQDKNGRKLRSDALKVESLAIILSGEQVAKCEPEDIWNNALKFKKWFEKRYKTKVRVMDWHRDEGSIDEKGEVKRNDHIHLEYDNVNEDGKMVRRLFSKGDLIGFQDKIAEIYKPLGFKRGEDTSKKKRSDKPKIGIPQKKWKKKKIKEELAKVSDVKKINKNLRDVLKEAKAKAPEYRELEAKIRQLTIDAKANILTISELEEQAYTTVKVKKKLGKKTFYMKKKKSYKELYEKELMAKIASTPPKPAEKSKEEERLRAELFATKAKLAKITAQPEKVIEKEKIIEVEVIKEIEIEKIVYREDTVRIEALEDELVILGHTIKQKNAQIANLKQKLITILTNISKSAHSFINSLKIGITEMPKIQEETKITITPSSDMIAGYENWDNKNKL